MTIALLIDAFPKSTSWKWQFPDDLPLSKKQLKFGSIWGEILQKKPMAFYYLAFEIYWKFASVEFNKKIH